MGVDATSDHDVVAAAEPVPRDDPRACLVRVRGDQAVSAGPELAVRQHRAMRPGWSRRAAVVTHRVPAGVRFPRPQRRVKVQVMRVRRWPVVPGAPVGVVVQNGATVVLGLAVTGVRMVLTGVAVDLGMTTGVTGTKLRGYFRPRSAGHRMPLVVPASERGTDTGPGRRAEPMPLVRAAVSGVVPAFQGLTELGASSRTQLVAAMGTVLALHSRRQLRSSSCAQMESLAVRPRHGYRLTYGPSFSIASARSASGSCPLRPSTGSSIFTARLPAMNMHAETRSAGTVEYPPE